MVASKGAGEEEEAVTAGSVASAAKGKLVSSMMKKYLAEAMVPMLLELRRALEAARHPLLGQLLATLASLLKEHKHEVGACPVCCLSMVLTSRQQCVKGGAWVTRQSRDPPQGQADLQLEGLL